MNNQRATRSKSLLALEMSFIGLLAWVVFSSLIAWQGSTVQAGNEDAAQQMQRPVTQGNPEGRSVPPEGAPRSTRAVAALGTPNACTGFDFNSGAQGFTTLNVSGASSLWHLDNALCRAFLTGHSTPFTFYYGQDATCNYQTGARNASNLISPAINLVGTFPPYSLGFNYLLFVESSSSFDTTFVDVSTDGGTTWIATPAVTKAGLINDNQWHNKAADITALVGAATSVNLRFRFDSVDNLVNSSTGWHVDDVLVCGQPFNFCVQDDSTGDYVQVNTVTGVFVTKQCSSGFTAQGVGTVSTNGSNITVTQKGPTNFSSITVNTSTHTGFATIRVQSGLKVVAYNINDSNTNNNTCVCP